MSEEKTLEDLLFIQWIVLLNMKVVFKHPYILASYKQHLCDDWPISSVKEHLFSKTGAQLATDGIT